LGVVAICDPSLPTPWDGPPGPAARSDHDFRYGRIGPCIFRSRIALATDVETLRLSRGESPIADSPAGASSPHSSSTRAHNDAHLSYWRRLCATRRCQTAS